MRLKIIFFRVSFAFFFLVGQGCAEDPAPEINSFPIIETSLGDVNKGGANFNAEILFMGNNEILEYGFIMGVQEGEGIEEYKVVIPDRLDQNSFSYLMDHNHVADLTYNFKAYVRTEFDTLTYNNVRFVSQGVPSPEFIDFFPQAASQGDVITITGNYFPTIGRNNYYRFFYRYYQGTRLREVDAHVISATKNEYQISFPFAVNFSFQSVELLMEYGHRVTTSSDFVYKIGRIQID